LISDNFYWRALPEHADNLQALNDLPRVKLVVEATTFVKMDSCIIKVSVHNPGSNIALMTHFQLRNQQTGERVLPVYYSDNYVSLVPNETKSITITASRKNLKGGAPVIFVDGWNIDLVPDGKSAVKIMFNSAAQVSSWPVTGLPIVNQ